MPVPLMKLHKEVVNHEGEKQLLYQVEDLDGSHNIVECHQHSFEHHVIIE